MWTLVTGAAGFIGFHLCARLLADGCEVVGIDNLSDYYDVELKQARLQRLAQFDKFRFERVDISCIDELRPLFTSPPSYVVNLAAQPGVRYSIDHPFVYARSNVDGFLNVLECCRHAKVAHLVYASSSSVYGGNQKLPFAVGDNVDHPVSLYAATKKANELMAHCYSTCTDCPPPACVSLRCMDPGIDPIWRYSPSPKPSWLDSPSRFSTMATWSETSPTSTT